MGGKAILSPPRRVRILHLEDSAIDAELVCEILRVNGLDCDMHRVWTRDEFSRALAEDHFDLILADHRLPAFDGEQALEIARDAAADTPFVFVSGTLGEDVAVEALRRGATDYVIKQRLDRLPAVVGRALSEAAERAKRRRAEAALRESEANFATLVDVMPQLSWMARPDGYIFWYNRRWYEYTGTTPEQMEGWGWTAVHDPAVVDEVIARFRHTLETSEPFEMTFPLLGADGRFRPFLTRMEPVRDEDGRLVRWLGTNTDISEQQRAEEDLKRLNETLESRIVAAIEERETALSHLAEMQKMETIGQLTGGVAHDFNNLLTPIVGNLDLLRRRVAADDERSQRLIAGALQGADRAKTLVQRLLAFARRQVLEARPVDVPALVDGLQDLIGRTLGPQIKVSVSAAEGLPSARVDPGQLELALLNLAVNARDAMPGGGTLTIGVDEQTVGPDHPDELRHGRYIRLAVGDSGTGMDAATLKRAIEPFYSTKGIGKGTGLGLSMVHGLAAQSGGALRLSSRPGEGTCAEIWLPVSEEPADSAVHPSGGLLPRTRPSTILLVDDEELVRTGTREMLADLGQTVIEAASGTDALEQLRRGARPDLVVTDYLMPGMNGAELAAEVQRLYPGLPVLLATGYVNLAGHQMASVPLLPKPFRQAELASRLAELLPAEAEPALDG